jgi:UDP-2,4-diacetamido-2,4,6-trideoxy-beta-L-altropyranose hydrolase
VKKTVFIRADANRRIGYGHLARCFILAEELIKYHTQIVFLFRQTDTFFKKETEKKGFRYVNMACDEPDVILDKMAPFRNTRITLIFDTDIKTYFQIESQHIFINQGIKLVFFTFWDQFRYDAHLIINQNPISLSHRYDTAGYTKNLLGPEYMIFRDEIIALSQLKKKKYHDTAFTYFISFGGSDQPNRTVKTLKAIQLSGLRLNIKKIHVVIGNLYPHEKELVTILPDLSFPCQVHKQTDKMAEIMGDSDLAICAGGLTLWELALFNIPTAIISYSRRENMTAGYLHRTGLGYHLGSIKSLSCEELSGKIVKFAGNREAQEAISRLKDLINPEGKKIIAREINNLTPDD